ncbi:20084_t:CDS:2, partial [Gigaspora margarita]
SGTGKTSIETILAQDSNIIKLISTTTRPKREGEIDNNYYGIHGNVIDYILKKQDKHGVVILDVTFPTKEKAIANMQKRKASEEEIQRRLIIDKEEEKSATEYDYILVIDDNLEEMAEFIKIKKPWKSTSAANEAPLINSITSWMTWTPSKSEARRNLEKMATPPSKTISPMSAKKLKAEEAGEILRVIEESGMATKEKFVRKKSTRIKDIKANLKKYGLSDKKLTAEDITKFDKEEKRKKKGKEINLSTEGIEIDLDQEKQEPGEEELAGQKIKKPKNK